MKHKMSWILVSIFLYLLTCGCSVDTDDAYQQGGAGGAHNVPTGGAGGLQGGVAGSHGEAVYVASPDELRPLAGRGALTVGNVTGTVREAVWTETLEPLDAPTLARFCRAVEAWRRAAPFEIWSCEAHEGERQDRAPVWHVTDYHDPTITGWVTYYDVIVEGELSERCALSRMIRMVGRVVGGDVPLLRDSVDGAVMRENNQCEIIVSADDIAWLNDALLAGR